MSLDLNSIPSTSTKKDFGRMEDGTYGARIVSVIDLGIQHAKDWKTQKHQYHVLDEDGKWAKNGNDFLFTTEPTEAPDLKPQVMITFEFPTERIEINDETKPRWMGKEYTLSANEKAGLVKLIAAVKPGTTKLGELINAPCFVSIGSTDKGKAKITGVSAPMKGVVVDDLENPTTVFSLSDPKVEEWDKIPEFLKKKIKEAVNLKDTPAYSLVMAPSTQSEPVSTVDDDDIPF